jgi:hypothetical protein
MHLAESSDESIGHMITAMMKACLKICHLPASAFLPTDEIPGAFKELKLHLPEEASRVQNNYVQVRSEPVR